MTAPMSFAPQMQVVLGERLAGPPTVINVAQVSFLFLRIFPCFFPLNDDNLHSLHKQQ